MSLEPAETAHGQFAAAALPILRSVVHEGVLPTTALVPGYCGGPDPVPRGSRFPWTQIPTGRAAPALA